MSLLVSIPDSLCGTFILTLTDLGSLLCAHFTIPRLEAIPERVTPIHREIGRRSNRNKKC
jgi:hypothetical protein